MLLPFGWPEINRAGLPHSETPGSKRVCRSPGLIAACRVLRRPLAPRHPSCALILISCLRQANPCSSQTSRAILGSLRPAPAPLQEAGGGRNAQRTIVKRPRPFAVGPEALSASSRPPAGGAAPNVCSLLALSFTSITRLSKNRWPQAPSFKVARDPKVSLSLSLSPAWREPVFPLCLSLRGPGPDRARTCDPALIKRML